MKMLYSGGFLEDIQRVGVQSGWQLHFLDLQLTSSKELGNARPFWTCALKKLERYFNLPSILNMNIDSSLFC